MPISFEEATQNAAQWDILDAANEALVARRSGKKPPTRMSFEDAGKNMAVGEVLDSVYEEQRRAQEEDESRARIDPQYARDRMADSQMHGAGGVLEQLKRYQDSGGGLRPTEQTVVGKLPIVGHAVHGAEDRRVKQSWERLGTPDFTARDADTIARDLRQKEVASGRSWGELVGHIVTEIPRYAGEFLMTGGAYRAGKLATTQVGRGAGLSGRGAQLFAGTAGRAAGVAAQVGVNAPALRASAEHYRIPAEVRSGAALADEASFRKALEAEDPGFIGALPQGFLSNYIEVASEHSGKVLMRGLGWVGKREAVSRLKDGVGRWWLSTKPGAKMADLTRAVNESGWGPLTRSFMQAAGIQNPFIEEAEERVVDIGTGLTQGTPFELEGGWGVVGQLARGEFGAAAHQMSAEGAAFMGIPLGRAAVVGAATAGPAIAEKVQDVRDRGEPMTKPAAEHGTEWGAENPIDALNLPDAPSRKQRREGGIPFKIGPAAERAEFAREAKASAEQQLAGAAGGLSDQELSNQFQTTLDEYNAAKAEGGNTQGLNRFLQILDGEIQRRRQAAQPASPAGYDVESRRGELLAAEREELKSLAASLGVDPNAPAADVIENILQAEQAQQPAAPMQYVAPGEAVPTEEELQANRYGAPGQSVPLTGTPAPAAPQGPAATGFTTSRGSTYVVHDDGTTTRERAGDLTHTAGPQPRSEQTVYLPPETNPSDGIGFVSSQGGHKWKFIFNTDTGHLAVQYTEGPDAGKIISGTVMPYSTTPQVGYHPLELWDQGTGAHIGTPITSLQPATQAEPPAQAAAPPAFDVEARRAELAPLSHPDLVRIADALGVKVKGTTARLRADILDEEQRRGAITELPPEEGDDLPPTEPPGPSQPPPAPPPAPSSAPAAQSEQDEMTAEEFKALMARKLAEKKAAAAPPAAPQPAGPAKKKKGPKPPAEQVAARRAELEAMTPAQVAAVALKVTGKKYGGKRKADVIASILEAEKKQRGRERAAQVIAEEKGRQRAPAVEAPAKPPVKTPLGDRIKGPKEKRKDTEPQTSFDVVEAGRGPVTDSALAEAEQLAATAGELRTRQDEVALMRRFIDLGKTHGVNPNELWAETMYEPQDQGRDIVREVEESTETASQPTTKTKQKKQGAHPVPDNIDELVAQAQEMAEPIARKRARGMVSNAVVDADTLASDAVSHLALALRDGKWNPAQPFENWARIVIRNKVHELADQEDKKQEHAKESVEQAAESDASQQPGKRERMEAVEQATRETIRGLPKLPDAGVRELQSTLRQLYEEGSQQDREEMAPLMEAVEAELSRRSSAPPKKRKPTEDMTGAELKSEAAERNKAGHQPPIKVTGKVDALRARIQEARDSEQKQYDQAKAAEVKKAAEKIRQEGVPQSSAKTVDMDVFSEVLEKIPEAEQPASEERPDFPDRGSYAASLWETWGMGSLRDRIKAAKGAAQKKLQKEFDALEKQRREEVDRWFPEKSTESSKPASPVAEEAQAEAPEEPTPPLVHGFGFGTESLPDPASVSREEWLREYIPFMQLGLPVPLEPGDLASIASAFGEKNPFSPDSPLMKTLQKFAIDGSLQSTNWAEGIQGLSEERAGQELLRSAAKELNLDEQDDIDKISDYLQDPPFDEYKRIAAVLSPKLDTFTTSAYGVDNLRETAKALTDPLEYAIQTWERAQQPAAREAQAEAPQKPPTLAEEATESRPDDVVIGEKAKPYDAGTNEDVRRWLNREQEKGKPAWFDGSHLYTVSGKYGVSKDSKGNPKLTKLHELSLSGLLRHFGTHEYISYNRAAAEAFEKMQAEEAEKQRQREEQERVKQAAAEEERRQANAASEQIQQYIAGHTPKGKKGDIEIATGAEKATVQGTQYGHLAIHGEKGRYKVTHVPTGMGVLGRAGWFPTQKMAKDYATLLSSFDLSFTEQKKMPEGLPKFASDALSYVQGEASLEQMKSILDRLAPQSTSQTESAPEGKPKETGEQKKKKAKAARQAALESGRKFADPTTLMMSGFNREKAEQAIDFVIKAIDAGVKTFDAYVTLILEAMGEQKARLLASHLEEAARAVEELGHGKIEGLGSIEAELDRRNAERPPEEVAEEAMLPTIDDLTGIKKAVVDGILELHGMPEMAGSTPQSVEEWAEQARITLAADPKAAIRLVNQLALNPTVVGPLEGMLLQFRYRQLANELQPLVDNYLAAVKGKDPVAIAQAQTELFNARGPMNEFEGVVRRVGEEWGRMGVVMQQMLRRDFSLEAILRRGKAENHGHDLDAKQVAELTEMAQQIKEIGEKFDAEHSARVEAERQLAAQKQHEEVVKEVKRSRARPKSERRKEAEQKVSDAWDAWHKATSGLAGSIPLQPLPAAINLAKAYIELGIVRASEFLAHAQQRAGDNFDEQLFQQAWAQAAAEMGVVPPQLDPADLAELTREARQIQRMLVEAGMTDRDEVFSAVHKIMQESLPDFTLRQTIDALGRYGQFEIPSQAEIEKLLRDMNAQALKLSQLDQQRIALERVDELRAQGMTDEQIGNALFKEGLLVKATGYMPDKPSQAVANLTKEYNENKKAIPATTEGRAGLLQSALSARERALTNRIRDVKWELENQRRIVNKKSEPLTSDQIKALEQELESLMESHREMFPPVKKPLTDEQRLERAIKSADREIARLAKQISNRNFDKPQKEKLTSAELESRRARLAQLRAHREVLKELELSRWEGEGGASKADGKEALARKIYMANLRRRMAEWQRILREGDFAPRPKKPVRTLSDAELKLKRQEEDLKKQVLRKFAEYNRAHLGKVAWTTDKIKEISDLSRAFMTMLDAPLYRQGAPTTLAHPIMAHRVMYEVVASIVRTTDPGKAKAILEGVTKENLQKLLQTIDTRQAEFNLYQENTTGPWAEFRQQAGLYLTTAGAAIEQQEEAFMGRWAEHIPVAAASARVHGMVLNQLRVGLFDLMAHDLGRNGEPTLEQAKIIAHYVNVATGRSQFQGLKDTPILNTLTALENNARYLNLVFFAARYVASRFQYMAMPFYLPAMGGIKNNWRAKTAIYKEYGRTLRGASAVLGSLSLLSYMLFGDDDDPLFRVEWDPRSSDFLKLIIGETRYDFLGGLQQIFVLGAQQITGSRKTLGGEVREFGEGPNPETRLSNSMSYTRKKLSPTAGAIATVLDTRKNSEGKWEMRNAVGQPETPLSLAGSMWTPITAGEAPTTVEAQGAGAIPSHVFGMLGGGLGTYGPKTEYMQGTEEQRQKQFKTFLEEMEWDSPDPPFSEYLTKEQMAKVARRRERAKQDTVYEAGYEHQLDASRPIEDTLKYLRIQAKARERFKELVKTQGLSEDDVLELLKAYQERKGGGTPPAMVRRWEQIKEIYASLPPAQVESLAE